MRFFNINDFYTIECMTLREYQLRLKAYRLKQVDKEYESHLSAWLNHVVGSTKKKGNGYVNVYPTFKSFFDYEKNLYSVTEKKNVQEGRLKEIAKRQEKWRLKNESI